MKRWGLALFDLRSSSFAPRQHSRKLGIALGLASGEYSLYSCRAPMSPARLRSLVSIRQANAVCPMRFFTQKQAQAQEG